MLNHIVLQGRLGADPELRKTQSGKSVVNVNIAVQRDGKDAETDWITIVAWERTADFFVNYFAKGETCIVSGRLQMRQYTDRNGNKRTAAEVVADHIYFAGSRSETQPYQSASYQAPAYQTQKPVNVYPGYPQQGTDVYSQTDDDEELPF